MPPIEPLRDTQAPTGNPEPQQTQQQEGAAPTSFRERKMAELSGEPTPDPGTQESLHSESAEDGYPGDDHQDPDGYPDETQDHGDTADEYEEPIEDGALFDTADDDGPDESLDDDEQDDDDGVNWKKRYQDLQSHTQEVMQNRKQVESEFAEGIQTNIETRHQLEDLHDAAKHRAQFFLTLANRQVEQYEQLDWQNIEPEQAQQMKQGYAQAKQYRDGMVKAMEEVETQSREAQETLRQRESEIGRRMLASKIPQWSNEHYQTLRGHAQALGYAPDEFNQLTDWRVVYMIHRDWDAQQAVKKVQETRRQTRKAKQPRRNARQQPRSADGKYRRAREEAHARPGDKGSFREMKMRQMERERRQGR